ncbi:hypothetical protein A9X06_16220 [Mycobacterium sp. 852002-51759_SCH5129042]|nr:hypothetical protein A5748_00945 [Nocardia sp. 852002-51244_SCH5132740]OBF83627.1 hypothetical protein A9X06_16220 [Mycobacterium sp. 852002-51759_SCH5129042]
MGQTVVGLALGLRTGVGDAFDHAHRAGRITRLGGLDLQLLGQPRHRHRRGGHHAIGPEPQPRQRAQRDRNPEPIGRTATTPWIDERGHRPATR